MKSARLIGALARGGRWTVMSKSRTRHSGRNPPTPTATTVGGPGRRPSAADLLPGAKPAINLGSMLAKAGPVSAKAGTLLPGLHSSASKSATISTQQAGEAMRCAAKGVRLIQHRHFAQGIELLNRAIELQPSMASLRHDLGVALMAAGQLKQAAAAFNAALALDPRLPSAHFYIGQILETLGRQDKAIPAFEAAVALAPDVIAAQMRLGSFYLDRRMYAKSEAAFRAAAAAGKGTVTAAIAEAGALEASGAIDEAVAAIRALVDSYPENAVCHSLLAMYAAKAGNSAESARHFERAAELSPAMAAAWSGLAVNKKFTAGDGPLIARMNAALTRANLPLRARKSLHLALGKAHDDLGNYEAAIRNFEAGGLIRLGDGFDRAAHARRIDWTIAATPPGYRDRQPDPGIEDAAPILIVGMPRSGTTLTEQILSSHPEIAAAGELRFWGFLDLPRDDYWSLTATPEAVRRVADDYLATLRAFGPGAKRITDKMPDNFLLLGLIHRVFPNATLIHCRRHPIDTALSILATDFTSPLEYASERGDLVFFYRQYERLMAHWRKVLPTDRLIEVDYEALVADPEPQTRRLLSACGLDWNDACLAPHLNTRKVETASVWQVRQPIYRTSVERWRRYEPWLGELRELAP